MGAVADQKLNIFPSQFRFCYLVLFEGPKRFLCLDHNAEDGVATTVVSIDHVRPSLKAGGRGSKEAVGLASAQPRFYIRTHPTPPPLVGGL